MTDRYRGPLDAGQWEPRYSRWQLTFLVWACVLTAAALGVLAGFVGGLIFVLGLVLGIVLGVAA